MENIWDWMVKYGLNWIIWEYVLYCLVTLRWSRIHRLWPKGWHVREVAILGPDLQGCFIFRSFQVYLILSMMEWPWISQSPPYIYVSTVHGDFLLITTLGFLNSCVNYYILGQTTAPEGKKGKLVTLGSRKELDCLVQFINDEFGEPTFEVKRCLWAPGLGVNRKLLGTRFGVNSGCIC